MKYFFLMFCIGLISLTLTGQPWEDTGQFNNAGSQTYRLGETAIGTQAGSAMFTVSNESMASPFLMFIECHADNGTRKALTVRDFTNTEPQDNFQIMATGQTFIGTSQYRSQLDNGSTPYPWQAMLWVNGKIYSEELVVKNYGNWPDYVFSPDYDLMSLANLEEYIKLNCHLPGIPSEDEVEAQGGIMTSEVLKGTLRKVEELTLYLIELNKKVESLEAENVKFKNRLDAL